MRRLLFLLCVALGCLSLVSCINDDIAVDEVGTRATMLSFDLVMPMSNTDGNTDGYDYGDIYENTLSNYKIYFYDSTDNKFITQLSSSTASSTTTDGTTTYTITGGVPEALRDYAAFKVVVIANWESYALPAAGSTIEDLCNSQYAQYTALKTEEFGTKSLPFYGVHTYTDVSFEEGETTELSGKLSLLRAVAKVEIILNNEDDGDNNISFSSVTLHNYNAKGYCAPKGVYSESDYGKATDWASDYTGNTLHLVNQDASGNGKNDDTPQKELQFMKTQDRVVDETTGEVTQKETWIAYIPEYDNSGTDYSYIDVKFDHQLSNEPTEYKIYFAVYDNDGTTKAYTATESDDDYDTQIAKRRDVHRNNLYRYNVTLTQGKLMVVPEEWAEVFDNEYDFSTVSSN